jgi:acetate kinase
MNKYLLVINAGSSSIKFTIYQAAILSPLRVDATGQIEGIGSHHSRFMVKDAQGDILSDCLLSTEEARSHVNAIIIIRSWLLEYLRGVFGDNYPVRSATTILTG